jgi:hypothetical protein
LSVASLPSSGTAVRSSLIPYLPTLSAQSAPGTVKTTADAPVQVLMVPHTSAGTITLPVPPRPLLMLLYRCLRLHILPPVLLPALYLFDMTRRLHTRLWLTNSFLLEYVILEPEKEILQNRLTLLPSDLVVILARTIVLVPMHALARMLVPAKTPVLTSH